MQRRSKVSEEEAIVIEEDTREQHASEKWERERKVGVTASTIGSLLKMRSTTKASKKVEAILYSTFKGSQATRYGTLMENSVIREYKTCREERGHSLITILINYYNFHHLLSTVGWF